MSRNAPVSFHRLPKASEEQQMPSSEQRLPPPVQTVGFLCTDMPTDVVGSAQIAAVSPGSWAYFKMTSQHDHSELFPTLQLSL